VAPPTTTCGDIDGACIRVSGVVDVAAPDAGDRDDAGDAATDAGSNETWPVLYTKYFHCTGTICHTLGRGGFHAGNTAASCYEGLVEAGLLDLANPSASPLVGPASPLVWFGGRMPLGAHADPEAAKALRDWVSAGASPN
jgi:hypothetical protein